MSAPILDTYCEVVTPEGVALHLRAAGPLPRALAWMIDLCIRIGVMIVMSLLLMAFGEMGQGIYLVVMFLVFWAYPILFEVFWSGRTPGKRALGVRVVADDGAPAGWMAVIVRNLLRTVDMLPFGYALGLLSSLADANGRRLGDHVARTLVVHEPAYREHAVPPLRTVVAPTIPLQPAEQEAVVAYGERAPLLSPARQVELADLAAPLTGTHGQTGVLRLYGMANWLLGRQ